MAIQQSHETNISTQFLVKELKQCGRTKDLQRGKFLHSKLLEYYSPSHMNVYMANTLISMYSKCGDINRAQQVFDGMTLRSVVSWNFLILGYVENGQSLVALKLFGCVDLRPNAFTFTAVLKACSKLEKEICLKLGATVHGQARKLGFDTDVAVSTTLVDMYSKCGDMHRAREVFDGMTERSVVSWTALIIGYVENGESSLALDVYNKMDTPPNHFTLSAALKACTGLKTTGNKLDRERCLRNGIRIHAKAKELGLETDLVVSNTLVDLYSKCGDMLQARAVFDRIPDKNVVSWTALIDGYAENGESSIALDMFTRMDCPPNSVTFVAVLKACTRLASCNKVDKRDSLRNGREVHRQAKVLGFDKDVVVGSTLVDMYSKYGDMDRARDVFDGLINRNVVTWNALLHGYVENGQSLVALELLRSMDCRPSSFTFVAAVKACASMAVTGTELEKESAVENGKRFHQQARELGLDKDVVVASTLVDMYGKLGDMGEARAVFDGMSTRDVVSWNVLIQGYVENEESSMALEVFNRMDSPPNALTFIAALKACGALGAEGTGQSIHDRVCELGWEEEEIMATCLVDFYAKCGNMSAAEDVFNRMHSRDTVSWNAFIGGYSSIGEAERVFQLVKRMEECGVGMNGVTMQLVLTACSHAGLVEKGLSYFESMSKYGLKPAVEHYGCMVDMLGRANRLEEALALVKGMPFEANGIIWTALLEASRKWNNKEVGTAAFNALRQ